VVCRSAEYPPASLLVADGRVTAADAQVGSGQHHRHGCLAQVVLIHRPVPPVLRLGQNKDNCGFCLCQVTGTGPDRRQLL
jgi:hypothetical protein